MSVKVMSHVWAHSKCTSTELVTVLALADWADDEGWCWPSLPKLAKKARVTVSQLCKIITAIEQQRGEVSRERSTGGRNRRTRYRVTVTGNSVLENSVTGNSVTENSVTQASKTVSQTRGALIHHRTINNAASKKSSQRTFKDKDPRVKEFIAWFAAGYTSQFKQPYHINGGKDGRLVKNLLTTFDLTELKQRSARLWNSQDKFISGTDKGIGILHSQINKLNGAALSPGRREMPA